MTTILRPAQPADHAAVRALLTAAFPTPDEADLVQDLRDVRATIELLACEADEVVGAAVVSEGDVGGAPVWALGPVAVTAHRRRQGIGALLCHAVVAAAEVVARRLTFVLGDPAYYARFGFVPAVPRGFTSRFVGGDVPEAAFQVRRPPGDVTPAGPMRYHAAFDRFG